MRVIKDRLRYSGERAHGWRGQVATLCKRFNPKDAVIAAYKFPLELPSGCRIDFKQAAILYDVVKGIGKGSLTGFLCAVHLSGFRLFPTAPRAAAFRNLTLYPTRDFADALHRTFGINTTPTLKLTPADLHIFVRTLPRKIEGRSAPLFDSDSVRDRLYKDWTGKSPNDKSDAVLMEIAGGMAQALCGKFNTWGEMRDDPEEALCAIRSYLQSKGDFPSLPAPSDEQNTIRPTIAFDPQSSHFQIGKEDQNKVLLVHQALAMAAHTLGRDNRDDVGVLQERFLTNKPYSGLSWLFGVGWKWMRNTPVDKMATELGVPKDRIAAVRQLKDFAAAIPEPSFFGVRNYSRFRTSVGGKLQSWISNYWKRLQELQAIADSSSAIDAFPNELQDEKATMLFNGANIDASGLCALRKKLCRHDPKIEKALGKLVGSGSDLPTHEDVECIEKFSVERGYFVALVNQINNVSSQRVEGAETDEEKKFWKECNIKLPEGMKELPKLNQISGGSVNAKQETENLTKQLNSFIDAQRKHFEELRGWMDKQGHDPNPISNLIKQEKQKLKGGDEKGQAEELGWRRLLNRVACEGRRLSDANRRKVHDLMLPLFRGGVIKNRSVDGNEQKKARIGKTNCNEFFCNHKGTLYRSPYSTSRHEAYAIDLNRAKRENWLAHIERLIKETEERLTRGDVHGAAEFRDWLRLRNLYFNLRLEALPEDGIPSDVAKLSDSISADTRLSPGLVVQLENQTVSRSVCLSVFNLYSSKLNGLCFKALREGFYLRAEFSRTDEDKLVYAPKSKSWESPAHLGKSVKPIGSAINKTVRDASGGIELSATLKQFAGDKFQEPSPDAVRAYLAQAPHDWYFPADFGSGMPALKPPTLCMEKNGGELRESGKGRGAKSGLRLCGPSSRKNKLDRALLAKATVQEATLIVNQYYQQRFSWADGKVSLNIEPGKVRLELAVPIAENWMFASGDTGIFDYIVAVDLGERGFSYAVFDIRSYLKDGGVPQPTVVGSIAIPSIRGLRRKVRTHRGRRQPSQKMQMTYSDEMEKYRKNVIGDVCHSIELLCRRYNAFPVLEREIGNFESGGNQLKVVYKSTLLRYTNSRVVAHETIRAHHWKMKKAGYWEHPYLKEYVFDVENKVRNKSKTKPLNLFPGTTVNAKFTSQICSKCGRNPLEKLKKLRELGAGKLEVSAQGEVNIGDGIIKLKNKSVPKSVAHERNKRNEHPQFDDHEPLRDGMHDSKRLYGYAKFHLRHKPCSKKSPDTTQSRYRCLYTDCGYQGHADENAAINIGRRFFDFEKIGRKESIEALDRCMKKGKKI